MAVMGDSAGVNLAAVVAQLSPVPLRFQVLIYPVMDMAMDTESYREFRDGPLLARRAMEWFGEQYVQGTSANLLDPRVSPLRAGDSLVRQSPPGMVITAECDPLRDEGEAYAARLAAVGVPVVQRRFDGQIHAFFTMGALIPAGAEAVAQACEQLRAAFAVSA